MFADADPCQGMALEDWYARDYEFIKREGEKYGYGVSHLGTLREAQSCARSQSR